jgi:hypothetical protein
MGEEIQCLDPGPLLTVNTNSGIQMGEGAKQILVGQNVTKQILIGQQVRRTNLRAKVGKGK